MAIMNDSLPDPMRDYVQNRIDSGQYASVSDYVHDLIRRDQSTIMDEERWLKELNASIDESLQEMKAVTISMKCATRLLPTAIKPRAANLVNEGHAVLTGEARPYLYREGQPGTRDLVGRRVALQGEAPG